MEAEKLTGKQIDFIQKELDLSEEEFLEQMEDYDKCNFLMDKCFLIEGHECSAAKENGTRKISERGSIASELVDFLHGPYYEDESEYED